MSNSRLVYSTANGSAAQNCQNCGKTLRKCSCGLGTEKPAGDGVIRISRQTKGRKGKGVCLIQGVPLPDDELLGLAKQLKSLCGTGGTVKDGVIEIQGDHRQTLMAALQARFERVKLAGG